MKELTSGKTITVLVAALLLLSSNLSFAYIPKFWMIMSRVAENHGRGVYEINQDIIFTHQERPIVINEKWTIKDGRQMKVRVSAKRGDDPIQLTFVYDKNRKFYIDPNGQLQTARTGKDWFEPFFHFRYSKRIKSDMLSLNMIPASAVENPPKLNSLTQVKHNAEDFLQLSRTQGKLSWRVSLPDGKNGSDPSPALWVEQDNFNILKLRMPSAVVVRAEDYQDYKRRLSFPQRRQVTWGDNQVVIQVNSIQRLGSSSKFGKLVSNKTLDHSKDPNLALRSPEDTLIAEFYRRFR